MELTEKIELLLEEKYLTDELFNDCFTVEVEFRPASNRLHVFSDSDSGMTFEKCQKLSRFLENYIDTNNLLGEKYVLEVSSPGVGRPFKFPRQYVRSIGRTLDVTYLDKTKTEGLLTAADETKIVLKSEVVK